MRLLKAHYEIITPINGEELLKQIEIAARTCYKSEDKIEYGEEELDDDLRIKGYSKRSAKSAKVLLPKLIARGHEAMLEFGGNITVKFICDRGVSHELVRHRIASFAQESTRYCNYGKDEHIQFIIPSWFNRTPELIANSINDLHNLIPDGINEDNRRDARYWYDMEFGWAIDMFNSETAYNIKIKRGWSPQQARSVLPNSLKTEINVSTNIREWRHILKLRTSAAAHPDMQYLMKPLLEEFQSKIPILFDDIKINTK